MKRLIILIIVFQIGNAQASIFRYEPASGEEMYVFDYIERVLLQEATSYKTIINGTLDDVYKACKDEAIKRTKKESDTLTGYQYYCLYLSGEQVSTVTNVVLELKSVNKYRTWLLVRKYSGITDTNGNPPRWNYDLPPQEAKYTDSRSIENGLLMYNGIIIDDQFLHMYQTQETQRANLCGIDQPMTQVMQGYCLPTCPLASPVLPDYGVHAYSDIVGHLSLDANEVPITPYERFTQYYDRTKSRCRKSSIKYKDKYLVCSHEFKVLDVGEVEVPPAPPTESAIFNYFTVREESKYMCSSDEILNFIEYYRHPDQFQAARDIILDPQTDLYIPTNRLDNLEKAEPPPPSTYPPPSPNYPNTPPPPSIPSTIDPNPNPVDPPPTTSTNEYKPDPSTTDPTGREPTNCEKNPGLPECAGTGTSGSCSEPPTCSQNNIQCAVLNQIWKNKCGDSVSGGDSCDSQPVCTGNIVECATLIQTHKSRCNHTELNQGLDFTDPKYSEVVAEETDLSADITKVKNQTGEFIGQCPADRVVITSIGEIKIPYTSFCDLASKLKFIVIMISTLIAIRNISNAVMSE